MSRSTIAALCVVAAVSNAAADDRLGRFTLDVKIDGAGQARAGADHAKYVTAQSVHMAFTLQASSQGDHFNLVDDAAVRTSMAKRNAAVRARMPSPEKQQEFALKTQAEAQACGGNVGCMRKVALKMSQQQAAWMQVTPERTPAEGRYFNYSPTGACRGEFTARIEDSIDGAFADVGGMRSFSGRTTADTRGDKMQTTAICAGAVTLDSRTNKLYTRVVLPHLDGHTTHTENGRVVIDTPKGEVRVQPEAWKWAVAQLQGAARSGVQRSVLRVPISGSLGGNGAHELDVEVRWAFTGP